MSLDTSRNDIYSNLSNIVYNFVIPSWLWVFLFLTIGYECEHAYSVANAAAVVAAASSFVWSNWTMLKKREFSLNVILLTVVISIVLIIFGGVKAYFNKFSASEVDLWAIAGLGVSLAIFNGLFSVFITRDNELDKVKSSQKWVIFIYFLSGVIAIMTLLQATVPMFSWSITTFTPYLPTLFASLCIFLICVEIVQASSGLCQKIKSGLVSSENTFHLILLGFNGYYALSTWP